MNYRGMKLFIECLLTEFDYSKCGVLKLTNIVAETTREDLKSVFQPITTELFISFEKGAEEAFMRFVDEQIAQKCLDQLTEGDKKLTTSKGGYIYYIYLFSIFSCTLEKRDASFTLGILETV